MYELAIIIPHLNDLARLRRCLASLTGQIGPRVEVLVVDNGSQADALRGLQDITQSFSWVRVVTERTSGAGAARNAGVAASHAPGLAFLDCDCVAAPDWVAKALRCSRTDGLFGGPVGVFDETSAAATQSSSGAQLFERVFAFHNERYIRRKGFSVTANLVTTRAVFQATGPFRAGVSEDVDWCKRAQMRGFELHYAPELQVSHPTRSTWPALRGKWRRLVAERFLLQNARRGRWAVQMMLTALSPLRDTVIVLRSDKLHGLAERGRCLFTLYRLRWLRAVWMGKQVCTGRA